MKISQYLTKILIVVAIAILSFFVFVKQDVYADNPCCDSTPSGWWSGECCYSSTESKSCCSVNDVLPGCGIIPCPGCDPDDPDDPDDPPPPPCNRCTLKKCSAPVSSTVNIWVLKNLYSCTDSGGCSAPTTHYRTCYEIPSDQPLGSLVIYPEDVPTSLGFVSDTHTGAGLKSVTIDDSVNNPIRMVATYTDSTSAEIEALYVWFKLGTETPNTPRYIDLDNSSSSQVRQTPSKEEFGFLMHKESGVWKAYVPGINGDGNDSGDRWLKATSDTEFYIYGPGGKKMVKININSIQASGNSIVLDFNASFNNFEVSVKDGEYTPFLQGNDTFGFTPYDNYTDKTIKTAVRKIYGKEQIRLYKEWKDSGKKWNIDLTKPSVSSVVITVVETKKTEIILNWSIDENISLKYVVVNATYLPGFKNVKPIRVIGFTGGGSITPSLPFSYTLLEEGSIKTGHLVNNYLVKITGDNRSGSLAIDVGDNGQGILNLSVTAFDQGGNVGLLGDKLDFRDWMITQGGLFYANAVDVPIRQFTAAPGSWLTKDYLNRIDYRYSDLSTELVGIKNHGILESPVKSSVTHSYMIRPYLVKDVDGYYSTLKGLFDRRKSSINNLKPISGSSISGSLTSKYGVLDNQIAYLNSSSLSVASNFVCDGLAVFFVSGNLNIDGRIKNGNDTFNKDACIFVVGGDVKISQGIKASNPLISNPSEGIVMEYDEVNAYILADGGINIEKESVSPVFDGLYVNGGLHTLKSEGLEVNRNLKLEDRLKYPVLIVDHHSKYGVLARTLFGGSLLIQKTEVGVKPY